MSTADSRTPDEERLAALRGLDRIGESAFAPVPPQPPSSNSQSDVATLVQAAKQLLAERNALRREVAMYRAQNVPSPALPDVARRHIEGLNEKVRHLKEQNRAMLYCIAGLAFVIVLLSSAMT